MKRTAIVVDKDLGRGEIGNVAAILMGQLSRVTSDLYDADELFDADGNRHAAIRFSTVLLEAGRSQILNLVGKLHLESPTLTVILFSHVGQTLHNEYETYKVRIRAGKSADLSPVAIIVFGDDPDVRAATKKFSLLR